MNIHSQEAMVATATQAVPERGGKRAAILDAALELFVDRGFHGTAVPALAQHAGVGAGTIYRYFANKEALVNELYRECKRRIASHVISALSPELAPRDLFTRFWRRTVEFARDNPKAFAFLELHHHAPYLDAESRAIEEGLIAHAAALIASMQERKAVKGISSPLMMSVIYGALVGFVRGAWEGRFPLDDEHIDAAETCAWEAIRS